MASSIADRIKELLADGFGVEDIAVKLSVPLEGVRFTVRTWRASGDLKRIIDRGKLARMVERRSK